MKLRKMAVSNIRHNFKKYSMYFFSLCFAVFTAYAFLGLVNNKSVAAAYEADTRYRVIILSFGVIISVFVFFFMVNSNNSFIRARKKEISTYALFGMTNGKIGKLLFLETMIVGGAALAIGIGLSVFFSKLVAMVLLKMTVPDFSEKVAFSFDIGSVFITMGVFFAFFCVLGLSGLRVIGKFELVDLFKADKMSEGKPKGSWFALALSLVFIGGGYFLAASSDANTVVSSTFIILALVISGTYFFFGGGFPKVIKLIQKNKKKYYRAENLISVTGFAHRIRSIGRVMATIAVLSAVATTAIATGFTLYANTEKNAYEVVGYDLAFYGGQDNAFEDVHKTLAKHGAKVTGEITVQRYYAVPQTDPIQLGRSEYFTKDTKIRVYPASDYNKLIELSKTDYKPVDIGGGNEALYLMPYMMDDLKEAVIGKEMDFEGTKVIITEAQKCNFVSFGAWHTLILDDELFDWLLSSGQIKDKYPEGDYLGKATVMNYTKPMSAQLNSDLESTLGEKTEEYMLAYKNYSEGLMTFGLIRFIGFFMSAVVMLMTASLLYFKQIMAAEEEKHLYRMLRKIGVDEKTQKRVITKRLLPVFFVPLLLGVVHSVFAMKSADTLVFNNIILSANSYLAVLGFSSAMYLVYAGVYGVFYLITKAQYIRTVKS